MTIEVLIIIAGACLLIKPLHYGMMAGAACYLVLANGLRGILLRHHRNGVKFMNARQYDRAADAFEASLLFFTQHEWVDKYRYITMFQASQASYKQMDMYNLGVCYACMNLMEKAKACLEEVLSMPSSGEITPAALALITEIDQAGINQTEQA